jgi:hypothetical protein
MKQVNKKRIMRNTFKEGTREIRKENCSNGSLQSHPRCEVKLNWHEGILLDLAGQCFR